MKGERLFQAAAQLYDGHAYLLLIEGEFAALERRAAQLQIIATGHKILALDETLLVGVTPRPAVEVIPELEAFIRKNLDAFGIPGAAVAIVQGGEVVYLEGFGVRDRESGAPVTPDTHMMIGSTGKTMTTMLLAALVDEGRFGWDTPVIQVFPGFAVADPDMTRTLALRHLVCACTGVPRRDYELFFEAEKLSAEAVIESLATFDFFTGFGEAFQYSNQLVAAAGYVAAAADGAEVGALYDGYVESLRRRVLDPIGMENTTLSLDDVLSRGEYAIPHQLSLDSGEYIPLDVNAERLLTPVAPAGAHWSTARDMARYLITHLNGGVAPSGTRVISEENLGETRRPQVPVTAKSSYGLGWFVGEYKGLTLLSHGGNTLGFTSDFAFLPEAGLGVVVLTNALASNGFNEAVRARLFELVYGLDGEVEEALDFLIAQGEAAIARSRGLIQERIDPDAIRPFLGRYTNEALGEIDLLLEDGRFLLDAGAFRSEVRSLVNRRGEPDGYMTYDAPLAGIPFDLELDEDGRRSVRLGQGAASYRFVPVE